MDGRCLADDRCARIRVNGATVFQDSGLALGTVFLLLRECLLVLISYLVTMLSLRADLIRLVIFAVRVLSGTISYDHLAAESPGRKPCANGLNTSCGPLAHHRK